MADSSNQILDIHSPRCVGIDFGTTNSLVSFISGDEIKFIEFKCKPHNMLPSIIGYKDELSFFAKQAKDFENIASFKKFISNPDEESELPKKIIDGISTFFVGNRWRSIIEISADLFLHLRHTTNTQLCENIRNAVLCVPARFDDYQRQLLVKAATKAGWRILRIVSEPTAGFLGQEEVPDGEFGIADLGGGTFDFSIVKSQEKVIQVIYTNGNTKIGGCHIDKVTHKAFAKSGVTLEQIAQLRETGDSASIEKDLKTEIAYFVKNASEQVSLECLKIIEKSPQIFSEIILIGGASGLLSNVLTEAGYKISIPSQKQLQVARGAARQAYKLQSKASPYLLLDVTPLSLGIEILNDQVEWIIPKNSRIPIAKEVIFTNVHDQQTHIKFKVVQGDSDFASECRNLGEFELEIEKRKAGLIKLEIRFIVDADGMITIRAKNLDTEELKEIKVSSKIMVS